MKDSVGFKRLYWHSRRGMLELDLILIPFLEQYYETLPRDDQLRYQALLKSEDQDMFKWFLGREMPEDSELRKIVEIINKRTKTPAHTD